MTTKNQFFLRLHGLWEGVIQIARPPPPPFDIETMEPIEPPWHAIKEWIPDDEPDLNWHPLHEKNQHFLLSLDNERQYLDTIVPVAQVLMNR